MKKVREFIKNNYIACTVCGVALLIVVASLITISIINHHRHKIITRTEDQKLYQYIGSMKHTFVGQITYEDDQITSVLNNKYSIVNSPIYFDEYKHVILPFKSEIVYYYRDNLSYQLPKYSELDIENNLKKVICNGLSYGDDSFIIYDGIDTYIIPDNSVLTIDGKKENLSALSYIVANQATLKYYNYGKGEFVTKENVKVANLKVNNVDIDLMNDVVVYNKKSIIIGKSIDNYPIYKEDLNGK